MFHSATWLCFAIVFVATGFVPIAAKCQGFSSGAAESCAEDTVDVSVAQIYGSVCGGSTRDLLFNTHAGETVTLPDIIITEKHIGVLRPEGYIALAARATTFYISGYGIPHSLGITAFDISGATVKAYRTTDNTDFTAYILGGSTLSTYVRNNTAGMTFKLNNSSEAIVGPVKIVVSGVTALIPKNAGPQRVYLRIGGSTIDNPDMDLQPTDSQGIGCELGSRATKKDLLIGNVDAWREYFPACDWHGPLTSWNAQCNVIQEDYLFGKPGSIFVVADVPYNNGIGGFYFMDGTGAWKLFTSCAEAPAYSTGTLGNCQFQVLDRNTDVSALDGTYIYYGFGLAQPGSPPGTACNDMIANE